MITSALKNIPGSFQVSAAQTLGGICDEHKLPAWGTLATDPPQKPTLNLPQRQDYASMSPFPKAKESGWYPILTPGPVESGERVNTVGPWDFSGSLMIIPLSDAEPLFSHRNNLH